MMCGIKTATIKRRLSDQLDEVASQVATCTSTIHSLVSENAPIPHMGYAKDRVDTKNERKKSVLKWPNIFHMLVLNQKSKMTITHT